jgi:hypothetical protein
MYLNHRTRVAFTGLALLALAPASALGQAARVGPTFSLGGTTSPVEKPDIAYDSVNDRYLQVAGKGFIEAHLLNGAGSIIGTFKVNPGPNYAQAPRVAFGANVTRNGGYLVTWHETVANTYGQLRGRIFNGDGTAVTSDFDIATGATSVRTTTDWTMPGDIAYSPRSGVFLATWAGNKFSTADVFFQRINVVGTLLGANTLVSAGDVNFDHDPSVAYNPDRDEFYIAYGVYTDAGRFGWTAGRRVQAETGAWVGAAQQFAPSAVTYVTATTYNTAVHQWLISWSTGSTTVSGISLDVDGKALSATTALSTFYGAYDALDLEYNPPSGSSLLVTHGSAPRNWEDAAVWIKSDGTPYDNGFFVTNTADVRALRGNPVNDDGNFNPRVTASTAEKKWLVVTSSVFAATNAQFVSTDAAAGSGGGTTTPTPPPPAPPPPPPPPPPTGGVTAAITAAKADFSGDGKPDLIWERDDGYLSAWKMSGTTLAEAVSLNPGRVSDPDWRIVGTGDLNGDGRPEIVWQHMANGSLGAWFMVGTAVQDAVALNPGSVASTAWRIVAVADMNGDGKADLIWQHTDGWLAIWFMDGATLVSDTLMNPQQIGGGKWKIVGAGDMNGDGKNDLIWQHADGWLSVWYMNGATMVDAVYLNPKFIAGSDWKIKGVIDINGDGKVDLIWQHTDGSLSAWLMNGVSLVDAVYFNPSKVNPIWSVVGPR